MKFYMLAIQNNGEFCDIRKMNNETIIDKRRYEELTKTEERYLHLLKIEREYNDLEQEIGLDEFKLHYQADPIKYAIHILKGYLRAYLNKNTTGSTGIVEKRMLVVSFCHRIEEGLIDYLDELEEFNS